MSETPYTPPPPPPPPPGGSYTPPPPPPPGAPANSDRTIMLVLSYLSILCLIPLLMKKDDADIQWHAKNGTVLFGAEIAWAIIAFFLAFVRIPFLGCGVWMISCFVWIAFLAISILCIVKATKGERFRLPVLTDIAEKM
jgi:fumarate reductase subunit D